MDVILDNIRTIPDFPKPGIQFRDITTLLQDPAGFREVVNRLVELHKDQAIDKVVAIESRGFAIGGAVAYHLGCGVVMARKPGKLPAAVESAEYELEYGRDRIEIHIDAIGKGDRCLVIDDLVATGGTANATRQVIEKLGGEVVGCSFIVALPDLPGVERLADVDPQWLVEFKGH